MPVLTCWRPQLLAGEGGISVGKLSLGKPSEGMGVKPATREKSGMSPAWEGARPLWGQHTLGDRPSNLRGGAGRGQQLRERDSESLVFRILPALGAPKEVDLNTVELLLH